MNTRAKISNALLLSVCILADDSLVAAPDTYRPTEPDSVVFRIPRGFERPDPVLINPLSPAATLDDPGHRLEQARHLISLGRRSGQPRLLGQAEALLTPLLDASPDPEVRLLQAHLLQDRHEFDRALQVLDGVLMQHPTNTSARLTQSVVHKVLGDTGAAVHSCRFLVARASTLVTSACIANALNSTSRARTALRLLETALGDRHDTSPELTNWAWRVLGDGLVGVGEPGRAVEAYQHALLLVPGDVRTLARLAAVQLDLGEYDRVRAAVQGHEQVLPLAVTLATAERNLDPKRAEAMIRRIREMLAIERRRAGSLHLRESSQAQLDLFDDAPEALQQALDNWQIQRELPDALLVLRAALAADDLQAAGPVHQWIEQQDVKDERIDRLIASWSSRVSHAVR